MGETEVVSYPASSQLWICRRIQVSNAASGRRQTPHFALLAEFIRYRGLVWLAFRFIFRRLKNQSTRRALYWCRLEKPCLPEVSGDTVVEQQLKQVNNLKDMDTNSSMGYWFLNTFVQVRISGDNNSDGISVLEHHAYHGDSPPLHIHHTEDEIFVVLEGEFRFVIGSSEHRLKPGETILAPKGIPHAYRVESLQGGKWLTITTGHDFENFVKAISRPAEKKTLPERHGPPTEEHKKHLTAVSAAHNIEIVGPPLH